MAAQGFFAENWTDENGNPAGGVASGRGFAFSYQNGPLGRVGTEERVEPNGAFVEDIIGAVLVRMEFYQTAKNGQFACEENEQCIHHLNEFLRIQQERTARRTADKTEGTHEGN